MIRTKIKTNEIRNTKITSVETLIVIKLIISAIALGIMKVILIRTLMISR